MTSPGDRRPAPVRRPVPARHAPVRRPVHGNGHATPDAPVLTGRPIPPGEHQPVPPGEHRPVPPGEHQPHRAASHQPIALVDLLDRVLAGGVVVSGEVRLAIADVDLVTVSLRALVSSVSTVLGSGPGSEDEAGD